MKSIHRTIFLTFLICGNALQLFSQAEKPSILDSIHVFIDNKMELNLSTADFITVTEKISKDLKSLHEIVVQDKNIPEFKSFQMTYSPNKQLTYNQIEPVEKIILDNSSTSKYIFKNKCLINTPQYQLVISFNRLEDVFSDSLIIKIKEVVDTTRTFHGRFATTYNYTYNHNTLIHNKYSDVYNGQMDMLALKLGMGANLIKNEPVIDITGEVSFNFSKKGILRNQYYLSTNLCFLFNENKNGLNTQFLNAGYRFNLSNKIHDPNWIGLEFGYLISREGEFFSKNTFKLGVNWELGRYLSIAPQLYFSDGTKYIYPGIRLGIGF